VRKDVQGIHKLLQAPIVSPEDVKVESKKLRTKLMKKHIKALEFVLIDTGHVFPRHSPLYKAEYADMLTKWVSF